MTRPLQIAICISAALVGAFLGRVTAPEPPAPISADTQASQGERPPWWPDARDGDAAPLPPECADLAVAIAEESSRCAALELEYEGEPIPWPEDVPADRSRDGFTAAVDEVIEQCLAGSTRTEVDCAEPPCMAAIWMDGDDAVGDVGNCPAWTERYGIATTQSTGEVDCGDDTTRRLMLLSPTQVAYDDTDTMMADWNKGDPVDRENRSKRLKLRWKTLRQDLPCPPAR